jgi:hypothetical protein
MPEALGGIERICVLVSDAVPDRLQPCQPAYVSIRQHTSQHTSAHVSIRQHTSAYVSIRQHTSAYVSIRKLVSML